MPGNLEFLPVGPDVWVRLAFDLEVDCFGISHESFQKCALSGYTFTYRIGFAAPRFRNLSGKRF
jgi:hypothetical protein